MYVNGSRAFKSCDLIHHIDYLQNTTTQSQENKSVV
jgi:hypothetical protein